MYYLHYLLISALCVSGNHTVQHMYICSLKKIYKKISLFDIHFFSSSRKFLCIYLLLYCVLKMPDFSEFLFKLKYNYMVKKLVYDDMTFAFSVFLWRKKRRKLLLLDILININEFNINNELVFVLVLNNLTRYPRMIGAVFEMKINPRVLLILC